MADTIARLPPFVLILALLLFWGCESLLAARPQFSDRRRRRRNLVISALGFGVAGLSGAVLLVLPTVSGTARWGLAGASSLPAWAVTVLGVLLLDLTDYWRHRISHRLSWLWRLHRLHHSDPQVDITTALRSHPVELALRPLFLAAAIVAFGIPLLPVLLYPVLQLPVLVFQHANIRLPTILDRVIAWVIPTPAMHLVHHSRSRPQTDSNYATFLTIWDRLFASFRGSEAPPELGLDGFDDDRCQTLFGMLSQPLYRMHRQG